jgi:hypothetical protein
MMRYFVISPDGQRFGPADLDTLNQWSREGRIGPPTLLQAETGGATFAASLLDGLSFPAAAIPPSFANYQRTSGLTTDDGSKDLRQAWIAGILSPILSFMCIFGLAATLFGFGAGLKAKQKGQAAWIYPIILCSVDLVLWIAVRAFDLNTAVMRFLFRSL